MADVWQKMCHGVEKATVMSAYMKYISRLYTRKGSWTIEHGVEHETRVAAVSSQKPLKGRRIRNYESTGDQALHGAGVPAELYNHL